MYVDVDIIERWIRGIVFAIGAVAMTLGIVSAWAPKGSIVLYQAIMAWFNWRVSPIDEARELRNTRRLGVVLMVLSGVLWGALARAAR